MQSFEEWQSFGPLMWLIAVGLIVAPVGLVFAASANDEDALLLTVVMPIEILAAFLLNVMHMRTKVGEKGVTLRFGCYVPAWPPRRIPFAEITEVRVVTYRPIRDSGGWGLRFGRFEGAPARFYTARGNRAVFVRTPARNYLIGSQDPARLLNAIETWRQHSQLGAV